MVVVAFHPADGTLRYCSCTRWAAPLGGGGEVAYSRGSLGVRLPLDRYFLTRAQRKCPSPRRDIRSRRADHAAHSVSAVFVCTSANHSQRIHGPRRSFGSGRRGIASILGPTSWGLSGEAGERMIRLGAAAAQRPRFNTPMAAVAIFAEEIVGDLYAPVWERFSARRPATSWVVLRIYWAIILVLKFRNTNCVHPMAGLPSMRCFGRGWGLIVCFYATMLHPRGFMRLLRTRCGSQTQPEAGS